MTDTERAAWRWLIAHEGYTETTLTFRHRANPDFLGADGRGWEVKFIRNRIVVFSSTQLPALLAHPACFLLLFRGGPSPEAVLQMRDLTIPGICGQYQFSVVDLAKLGLMRTSISLPPALVKTLQAKAEAEGRSMNNLVRRLLEAAILPGGQIDS